VGEIIEEKLRVFIVQIGKIPDIDRKELIKKTDRLIKKYKSQLRLLTLCKALWAKKTIKDFILFFIYF